MSQFSELSGHVTQLIGHSDASTQPPPPAQPACLARHASKLESRKVQLLQPHTTTSEHVLPFQDHPNDCGVQPDTPKNDSGGSWHGSYGGQLWMPMAQRPLKQST
jgi:hypothetical protein